MRFVLLLFAFAAGAAADCVTTPLSTGTRMTVTLNPGCDNRFTFIGVHDQVIAATIRPLDTPSAGVRLALQPPVDVHPPVISGTEAATLRYVLPSTGTYTVIANVVASGRYLVALDSRPANAGVPTDCVREELVNGERVEWELTSIACRFTDAERLASCFPLYAIAGDPVTITLDSPDFRPRIAIYSFDFLQPQLIADAPAATFVAGETARYWVMATTTEHEKTGRYVLTMSARDSGCLAPVLIREPADVVVSYGSGAKVSVEISGTRSGMRWEWFDMLALPTILESGEQLTTPPVVAPQYYSAQVTNPCGVANTRMVKVSPVRDRRRATH